MFVPVSLGRVTFTSPGSHFIRFQAVKAGSIVIDYIQLTKAAGPS
jgi:hypothetical protein